MAFWLPALLTLTPLLNFFVVDNATGLMRLLGVNLSICNKEQGYKSQEAGSETLLQQALSQDLLWHVPPCLCGVHHGTPHDVQGGSPAPRLPAACHRHAPIFVALFVVQAVPAHSDRTLWCRKAGRVKGPS